MHSAELNVHLEGEIPKVEIVTLPGFYTINITFDKSTVKFFVNTEQELTNCKNNFLWAFESPTKVN